MKGNRLENNLFYSIGGITINVSTNFPFLNNTFHKKLKNFQVKNPGEDIVYINHHIGLPLTKINDLGKNVYYRSPWAIYKKDNSWIYVISPEKPIDDGWIDMAIFNNDYTHGDFYHKNKETFDIKNKHSLTFFPTDQILIAQLLADREGIFLHSGAVILDGAGLMFIGHSGAGKSTTMNMLKDRAEILCDDRNIVRHYPNSFRVYGSWSHGDIPIVSASSAPLKAILFIKKSDKNRLIHIHDKRNIRLRLLACLIKPFLTAEWWDKTLPVIEKLVSEVSCYEMEFDLSGDIVPELEKLAKGNVPS